MWNNVILPRAEGAMWLFSRTLIAGPEACAMQREAGEESS